MDIGFIGLGNMGGPIAANLQKGGHRLTVHDRSRTAAEAHLSRGAIWASSACEVGEASEVVFTALPGPPEIEATAFAPDGLLAGMRPGCEYVDLSTNTPALVRRLHSAFAERGVHMLDAPVSGGPRGAALGKLSLWVGGEQSSFDKLSPLFALIAEHPLLLGPAGSGSVAKLVHNCAAYTINCAISEAFSLGVKAGVDPLVLFDAIRKGAGGRRRTFDILIDQFMPGVYEPAAFALKLAHKDVALATELGREMNVPMRMVNLAFAELTEAMNRDWANRDARSVMLLQQERAGVHVAVDRGALNDVLARDPPAQTDPKHG
jgi:3-hydroxyisobutyrate dehydrogenase-like beta-hydroxyacid dehydrogenase